jgi:UDP-N-acetylglucosamine--N-acetylmuramyl-(pentapeptide) pyrophosphoryl-undecaprenol N-acetylglucosamine transferase
LVPALETAEHLADLDFAVQLWYAGHTHTRHLVDSRQPRSNLSIEALPALRGGILEIGRTAGSLARRTWRYLKQHRHAVVVGFGGRFSIPVIGAARVYASLYAGIGIILHEQNRLMGRSNRWLARWAHHCALTYPDTVGMPQGIGTTVTGLPVRALQGAVQRQPDHNRFTVLIAGGSQGAQAVNALVVGILPWMTVEERALWRFVHIAGPYEHGQVKSAYEQAGVEAQIMDFCSDMQAVYAQADVVVGRAGASTLAEIALCGVPAVLIPYPHAQEHQLHNARFFEACGGAYVLRQQQASAEKLIQLLRLLKRDHALRVRMAAALRQAAVPQATANLVYLIGRLSGVPLALPVAKQPIALQPTAELIAG